MGWNYRLMEHTSDKGHKWLGIHEVFYTDDEGKIFAWTQDSMGIPGETYEEILESLEFIKKDISNQSILDYNMEPEGSLEDEYEEDDFCPKCGSTRWLFTFSYRYWECDDCGYVEHPDDDENDLFGLQVKMFERLVEEEAKKDRYAIYPDDVEVTCPYCGNDLYFKVSYQVDETPILYPHHNPYLHQKWFQYYCLICEDEFDLPYINKRAAAACMLLRQYDPFKLDDADYLTSVLELEGYLYSDLYYDNKAQE